jgi:uncharacterized protein (TIGR00255 family)
MTGFGRCEVSEGLSQAAVEIKTVNHRYIDISVRMPKEIQCLEDRVRESVQKALSRGKVDVYISYIDLNTENEVILNEGLVGSYLASMRKAAKAYDLNDDITITMIASLPDVVSIRKVKSDDEYVWSILSPAVSMALEKLVVMRKNEGESLCRCLLGILDNMEQSFYRIEERAPLVPLEYKVKLEERLKEFELQDVEPQRIAYEIAMFSDKCSIEEELTRLKSHILQFRNILTLPDAAGRKLDFLVQEMNREVNTIASKASDLEITNESILLKCEIEKLREQIQNLE